MSRPYSCNPSHQRPRFVQRQQDFFFGGGKAAQNEALYRYGAGNGRQKFSTSLGIVRSSTTASGKSA